MRQYQTIDEAIPEIRRDLTRALPTYQVGVQQDRAREVIVREALNYTYSLPLEAVRSGWQQFPQLAQQMGFQDEEVAQWVQWLEVERWARTDNPELAEVAASLHPLKSHFDEGLAPSYLYGHRLQQGGTVEQMSRILNADLDSRRAYLPIYSSQDSLRASQSTRIPCSLGYHFMVRSDDGIRRLHMTYFMRACDFDHFWLSDLLLAGFMGAQVACRLGGEVQLGNLVHSIISFHLIRGVGESENEEIY
jgi:thymidylate synthase